MMNSKKINIFRKWWEDYCSKLQKNCRIGIESSVKILLANEIILKIILNVGKIVEFVRDPSKNHSKIDQTSQELLYLW